MGAHAATGGWFWRSIPDWDDDDPDAEALDQAHWEHF